MIVDDHPVVRKGLSDMIAQESGFRVCGEAGDKDEAMDRLHECKPDLIIVDVTLGNSNGIELIKEIKPHRPRVPILVLSMHDEPFYAERCLKAGASGYVSKGEPPSRLMDAIRTVLSGDAYVSEGIARRLLSRIVAGPSGGSAVDVLTDRELQIFELIGQGIRIRTIAQQLHVSSKTVESHRENIKRKLQLGSAAELLQQAIAWTQSRQL